jgi:polysaccharide export outer membrane protein
MKNMMRYLSVAVLLALIFVTTASVPQQTIHPGDQLNVQVYGQPTLSENVTVLPDGSIEYPLLGRMKFGGMTIGAATAELSTKLARYVRHPYVTIAITQLGQPSVLVLGNVKNPGKYQLNSNARLTDAIAAAGGVADVNGALPIARISNPQGDITQVPLQQLLHNGDVALDRPLADGDVVYVPGPTMINVVVTGAVDHPGEIQVAQGDKLSMAIAKAGNSASSNADLNNIRVLRTGPNGHQHVYTVDLYKALEDGDGSADIALKKNDTIFVPQMKQKVNGSVFANSSLLYILGRLLIP